VNIGGWVAVRDPALFEELRNLVVVQPHDTTAPSPAGL
jgi:hypothetical protein